MLTKCTELCKSELMELKSVKTTSRSGKKRAEPDQKPQVIIQTKEDDIAQAPLTMTPSRFESDNKGEDVAQAVYKRRFIVLHVLIKGPSKQV